MNLDLCLQRFSLAILAYFFGASLFYVFIFILSFIGLIRHRLRARFTTPKEILKAKITPPISIIAPAFNEEKGIIASVNSLLRLTYEQYEVIVVNDGSSDRTLETLHKAFDLRKTARTYHPQLPAQEVRAIYRSSQTVRLIVVDKINGGKADALNAGINVSTYPLFCAIDADSVLEREALLHVVHPFLEAYQEIVATGGLVQVANGCTIRNGVVLEAKLATKWLVNFQTVEYFRSFLNGRMGMSMMNGLLLISGAFGLFRKQAVIDVGGYRHDLVGEDMELVVRLHHELRRRKKPCRIYFLPDPVCWTEVPESLTGLARQRNRWQRGLTESLYFHLGMFGNPRYGAAGLIGMPYFVFIEWLSPLVEVFGYLIFFLAFMREAVGLETCLTFFLLATVFGVVLSLLALLMEEVTYRRYPTLGALARLMIAAVLENIGYRQYIALVRAKGLWDWMRGKTVWGIMDRVGIS